MIIEESDFRLTPVYADSPMFDLEFIYTKNKGKKNETSEFRIAAYGVTLSGAVKRIAHHRINTKYEDQSIELKTYLKEYTQELKRISELYNL